MERDLAALLAAHHAARARRDAGLPSWAMTIKIGDVFHNEAMTFEQRRDAIVARIRASGWADDALVDREVWDLEMSMDVDEFDDAWSALYDRAGVDRVWIDTREGP